jgi:dTDP-4-amino-4,6-dideoxygalactose transaminase
MDIKFNDFQAQYRQHQEEFDQAISGVLASGRYILGERLAAFEKEFAAYIGVKYAVGVANGLEAIQIALMSLGVGPGDEVITTSHTAVATALAIVFVGARPVFADIDEYFHLDFDKLADLVSPRTKAIIPVHLYGQSAAIGALRSFCQERRLSLVEDCAQAHGATYQNQKVGAWGDIGCFSFYPTKNLGAFGDGGALTTNSQELYESFIKLRNYGQKNRYEHEVRGLNSRLDELQAAVLSVQLHHLEMNNEQRRLLAERYYQNLAGVKEVKLPARREHSRPVYHLFVIEALAREELAAYLQTRGIATLVHYPVPIHKQPCFQEFHALRLPVLESKVDLILSLPIHPYLSLAEVDYICDQIKSFYKSLEL